MRVTARGRVQVTLDIPLSDSWGGDVDTEQIHKQAKDKVLGMLRNNMHDSLKLARIVGDMTVTSIITEADR